MYRVAVSIVRDSSLAEDVVQEALIKAWRHLDAFRGDASLRTWLLRITHNTAISMLRTRRDVALDPSDLPEPAHEHVEGDVMGEAMIAAFTDALDRLDETSRAAIVLREVEGLAYEEIAEIVGVPLSTVKTRLFRARRQLADALSEWRAS